MTALGWITARTDRPGQPMRYAHHHADTLDGGIVRTSCGYTWGTHRHIQTAPDGMRRCPRCTRLAAGRDGGDTA